MKLSRNLNFSAGDNFRRGTWRQRRAASKLRWARPEPTARLLAIMFASDDVCQRSLDDIAAEGFARSRLPVLLRECAREHGRRGDQGAGVGRRADLAEP